MRLFATRGYAHTSVHDIRKAAEVSIGAVYHHFANKEAIARALLAEFDEKVAGALQDIRARHHTAHDRCLAAVAFLFALSESFPEATAFYLFARHGEFLTDEISHRTSPLLGQLQEMVEHGIANGEIRDMTPHVATACLFGGPLRMIRLLFDDDIKGPLLSYLEEVWDCAWRSIGKS